MLGTALGREKYQVIFKPLRMTLEKNTVRDVFCVRIPSLLLTSCVVTYKLLYLSDLFCKINPHTTK